MTEEKISRFSNKHKPQGSWAKDLPERIGRLVAERFMVYEQPRLFQSKDKTGFFLSCRLGDRTGQINLKIWQIPRGEEIAVLKIFEIEKVYMIEAQVSTWQNQVELHVTWNKTWRTWQCQPSEYFQEDFCLVFDIIKADALLEMKSTLEQTIKSVQNVGYRQLLQAFWDDLAWQEKFCYWPAAKKHHHAYIGGLLDHVSEMLKSILDKREKYLDLDFDLLMTGIIFHDMGKLEEYCLGVQISYNEEAFMLGHMAIAVIQLQEKVIKQGIEISQADLHRLFHLILSHHGPISDMHGSAIDPKTPEAKMLCALDVFSATMNKIVMDKLNKC